MNKKAPLFLVLGTLFSMPFHVAQATAAIDAIAQYRIDPARIKAADTAQDGEHNEEKHFQIASITPSAPQPDPSSPEPQTTVRVVRKISLVPTKQTDTPENSTSGTDAQAAPTATANSATASVPPYTRRMIVGGQQQQKSAISTSRAVQRAVSYTVRGKRYTTLADSDGFVQTGKASWYGKRFHGRKTASGERYNMNAMTAAHKKLPFGSKIEVTNNANGKKVIVTVNDRGPFHGNRILDLSKAAAQKLGVIQAGTADVTIRAL